MLVPLQRFHLDTPLRYDKAFSEVKNSYIKNAYNSINDDYGSNVDYIFRNGEWFYTTEYADFGSGEIITFNNG